MTPEVIAKIEVSIDSELIPRLEQIYQTIQDARYAMISRTPYKTVSVHVIESWLDRIESICIGKEDSDDLDIDYSWENFIQNGG